MLQRSLDLRNLSKNLLVYVCKGSNCRNFALKVFVGKYNCTVYKVSVDGYKLAVVAGLEIFPCKVVVFGLRSVCAKYVSQHILFAGEVYKVLVQPYSPVA